MKTSAVVPFFFCSSILLLNPLQNIKFVSGDSPPLMQQLKLMQVKAQIQGVSQTQNEEKIVLRRLRAERLLVTIHRVAELASQLSPDRAHRVEPVLVNLAEQTVTLTSREAAKSASTDVELEKLEVVLDRLASVLDHFVEPEVSL
jgi:hypothetical protein